MAVETRYNARAREIDYLHENIDLRFGIEIRFYRGSHGLFQVQRELGRFVVPWSTFPFAPAERGHAVLTVDQSTVVGRFGPVDSNLKTTHIHTSVSATLRAEENHWGWA